MTALPIDPTDEQLNKLVDDQDNPAWDRVCFQAGVEAERARAATETTVQSYAEAELLPAGSVIRTANGMVCEKDQLGFWGSTTPPELSRRGPRYPAVLLYRPDTTNHEGATS